MIFPLRFLGLVLLLIQSISLAWASEEFSAEAWLLQMPKRYSEAFETSYQDLSKRGTLETAISKFQQLQKANTFQEIALFTGGGTATPDASASTFDTSYAFYSNKTRGKKEAGESFYYGAGEGEGTRKMVLKSTLPGTSELSTLTIVTAGFLGKNWSPTAVFHKSDRSFILLERNLKAKVDYYDETFALTLMPQPDEKNPQRVGWYLSGLTTQMPLCLWEEKRRGSVVFSAEIYEARSTPLLRCRFLADSEKKTSTLSMANLPLPTLTQPKTTGVVAQQLKTEKATIRRYLTDVMQAQLEFLK